MFSSILLKATGSYLVTFVFLLERYLLTLSFVVLFSPPRPFYFPVPFWLSELPNPTPKSSMSFCHYCPNMGSTQPSGVPLFMRHLNAYQGLRIQKRIRQPLGSQGDELTNRGCASKQLQVLQQVLPRSAHGVGVYRKCPILVGWGRESCSRGADAGPETEG